ncbi:duf341 domain-containing protein [Thozetella sp. PMI_491]|nr:duf341 domain-containing protein [Thozetella sp. PMI_491]
MKFLCLPGAYGSAKNFQVQLGPFVAEAEKRGTAEFKWTQGAYEATPPPGFEDYFGAGPLFRFIKYDGMDAFDLIDKIRDFPEGTSPEETMRALMGKDAANAVDSVRTTLQMLIDIIDSDPEIEGILGYSEGATTAASLILEERVRSEKQGRPRRIKRAIFFAGWPPLSLDDGEARVLLADECEDVIDVPTLHIVGCSDPYILGALALYNMCDEDSAELFDHGKGHTVPRDARTIKELVDGIKRLTDKKESWDNSTIQMIDVKPEEVGTSLERGEKKGPVVAAVALPIGAS